MKYWVPVFFIIILLALLIGGNIYLANRFHKFFPVLSYRMYLWIFLGIGVVMITGLILFLGSASPVGRIVFSVCSVLASLFLYLLLSVALVDIINIFVKLNPSVNGVIAVGLSLIVLGCGIWSASTLRVKEVIIPVHGLSKEIRAVQLTDIHLGTFRGKKYVERVVRKVNELHPDVVFNTGDLFDSKVRIEENGILNPFKQIEAPHYFVEGNHDQYAGINKVVHLLKESGVIVLRNEVMDYDQLQIIGLNHMRPDNESFDIHAEKGETIKDVLARLPIDTARPTVLLHHGPSGLHYANEKNVDLMLSGHTHGGQMFPFTLIAKLMFGYNNGLYDYENMKIYVSPGLGSVFAPLRVGTRSEITLLRLVPES